MDRSSPHRRVRGTLAASAALALLGAAPAQAADTTDPTISITSPTQGQVVSGQRSIAAAASDGGGIARVEFRRGTKLLSSDSSSPYVHSWNTTYAPEGAHTLYAKAIDRAGNSRTASLSVTVRNSPSVSFTAPTQGKTVAGTLQGADCAVAAQAPAGVARVEFFRDGVALNSDSTAPYSCSFDSNAVQDGAHTLSAKVVDSAGRTASSSVAINVDNPDPVAEPEPDPVVSGRILTDWSRLSMWDYIEEVSADRVREDSLLKRHPNGAPSIRFELRDGEHGNGSNSGERAEIRDSKTGLQKDGEDVHYGWSSYLAPGFSVADPDWRLIIQWHASENPSGSPPLDIQVKKGKFYLTLVKSSDGTYNGSRTYTDIEIGDATTGKWHDFVMQVKWSKSATVGRVKVWNNGVLKADRAHRTIYTNSVGNYIKAGVYRNNNYTNTDIAYMNGLRGASTFEAADTRRP